MTILAWGSVKPPHCVIVHVVVSDLSHYFGEYNVIIMDVGDGQNNKNNTKVEEPFKYQYVFQTISHGHVAKLASTPMHQSQLSPHDWN